ncbi:MAG: TonB-dependent receptor [Pseudomonadales bacterium]|nr:TonB-dependent receptor [Pseudomonadales bacterium]
MPFGGAQLPAAFAADDGIEEVVVTGSRIQRGNANSPAPISTINSDDILRSGQPDIAEILNDNPSLLSSITGTNSIDSEPNNVGAADNVGGSALDLRGLGFERTLTLVNGRRHVAGIEGTSSVDVSTIPAALIERVEVLTGGASAVYGADAVTGVVNFVLKEDFEGFEVDFTPGISGEGDNESYRASATWGRNFAEGRGNFVVSFQTDYDAGLRKGDRKFFDNDGPWDNDTNPARRFQQGEIDATATPNLARYYNFDNTGLFPWGLLIPSAETFAANYESEFGTAPTLNAAELALIERAATAAPQAILPGRTFNITSPYGVVAIGDFGLETPLGSEPDLDGNGISDCLQSFTGYNSSLDGAAAFGAVGGCWAIDAAGNLQPYEDGLVSGNFNQFGAAQSYIAPTSEYVIPKQQRYSLNFNGRFEFAPQAEAFWETKYVYQEIDFGDGANQATDLLYAAPDNPFIPAALQPFANNGGVGFVGPGGIYINRDSDDWGNNVSTNERTTYRFVGGLRGDFDSVGLSYEVSANYGRFERDLTDRQSWIADRFFAAIDVVSDPVTGDPICRSDLDPTAYPVTTPFNFPAYLGGGARSPFFTFTPGDGQCRPANLFGGQGSISPESIAFFTRNRAVSEEIEQTVFSGFLTGDSSRFFSLPAGAVEFAVGAEWREEKSQQEFDDFDNGIIQVAGVTPDGTPFSPGDFVGDVSAAASLGASPGATFLDSGADYDVWDVFAEVSVPLLSNAPFARELTVDAAWRRADYSTFGSNTTYSYGGVWSPVEDLRFRGSFNRAVRVPNLFELFSPDQGVFFRPRDPCDVNQLSAGADPALRQANCEAALQAINVPTDRIFDANGNYIFVDPLSAGFPGVTGGNSELTPEEGDTTTFGVVLQPRFLPDLTVSVDFWDIQIEDAIVEISSQNIVDRCYDSASLNNAFCSLLRRNDVPTSAQAGGFTFLRQAKVNFGSAEASGWDATVNYGFDALASRFEITALLTHQDKLEFIEPAIAGQADSVDDELGEMRRPEWSSQLSLTFLRGPLTLGWQTQYLSEQTLAYEDGGEIETAQQNFGAAGFADEIFIHNLSGSYDVSDRMFVYGGIQNVTDEDPFVTERAYPVSPRGRYFFAGVNYRL